jgi:hypothetical protein
MFADGVSRQLTTMATSFASCRVDVDVADSTRHQGRIRIANNQLCRRNVFYRSWRWLNPFDRWWWCFLQFNFVTFVDS